MKVLIIGSGGREHALAWRIAESDLVELVYVAPGNAGTGLEANVKNVELDPMNFDQLVGFAIDNQVELTVVGPEDPLVAGIVDRFTEEGLACFGPSKAAAQLEGSKSYTKAFLQKYNIPTADYQVFDEVDSALAYLQTQPIPIVVKADGLAAGKGVVVAHDKAEAEQAIREMLSGEVLGGAGRRIVIEECLQGEEASFIVVADGEHFVPLATSQDHKAAYNGDQGPNTGGMGAYSPAPVVTPDVHQTIVDRVILPTIRGMQDEGCPFTGVLYAGLMIDQSGNPKVIEFNCRFGDPETQPILMRMKSDLVVLLQDALAGRLDQSSIEFDEQCGVTVVLASGGYPGSYEKGTPIDGLDDVANAKVFHASTALHDEQVVTAGGRVLGVTALGKSVRDAQKKAYEAISDINFDGMEFRTDIGYRAIARETVS